MLCDCCYYVWYSVFLDMPAHEHRACIGILALCLMAEGYAVDISYVPRDTV